MKKKKKKLKNIIPPHRKGFLKNLRYCIAAVSALVVIFVAATLIYPKSLITHGVAPTWTQTNWVGGSDQTDWSDATKFSSSSNIDYSTTGQLILDQTTYESWASGGVRATETALAETTPRSVASGTGAIVAFLDTTTSPTTLRAQKMNTDGARAWPASGTENGIIIDQSANISTAQIPKIVGDGDDGAIVVWESGTTLYAQRIDGDGTLLWNSGSPVQVSTATCVGHDFDAVSDNANGVNVAFRKGDGTDIQGQRILSNGGLSWGTGPGYTDGKTIKDKSSPVMYISLATDGDHGFYFGYVFGGPTWNIDLVDGGGDSGGWIQSFDISITNSTFPVVISDGAAGGVVTVWEDDTGGTSDIYISRINNSGTQLWGGETPAPIRITNSADTDIRPKIALLDSGSVGITWSWKLSGGGDTDRNIYLQKIKLSDGSVFSANWPAGGTALLGANMSSVNPTIAQDGSGGAYVFWGGDDGVSIGVIGQRIDSNNSLHNGWVADGTIFGNLSQESNSYFINMGDSNNLFVSFVNTSVYVQKIPDALVYLSPGSLTSSIFDAGEQLNWGSLGWTADIPAGSSLSFETRGIATYSGNMAVIDDSQVSSKDGKYCHAVDCGVDGLPAFANDGITDDPSKSWMSDFNNVDLPEWLQIDLKSVKTVSKVVLYFPNVGGIYYTPDEYKIQTSTNGSTWTDQATVPGDADENADPVIVQHSFTPVQARYVRLYMTSIPIPDVQAVIISEFEVYSGSDWSCGFGTTCVPVVLTSASGASGSIDLSSLPDSRYIQYKATFSATDTSVTPTLYDISAYIFTASSAKAITSFNLSALDPAVTGTVNETAKTIALSVPYGTAVTALVPTIAISALASISPTSGVAQNFTSPVTYTVTAEDASTQAYTVTVTVALTPPTYLSNSIDVPIIPSLVSAQTPDSSVTVELNPSVNTQYNGSILHLESSFPSGNFSLNLGGVPFELFDISILGIPSPSFSDPLAVTFSITLPSGADPDALILYHDALHNGFTSGVVTLQKGDPDVAINFDPSTNTATFSFLASSLSNFILALKGTPTPDITPISNPIQAYPNTLFEVQASSIPEFDPLWGLNYSKDGKTGRVEWALEHRYNIYQSYIDILGRYPTSLEVNWWLQKSDDIWLIRWLFLTSEEYKNKHQ